MINEAIDGQQVGIEKSIFKLILKICKLQGGLVTAIAMESVAADIRQRVATAESDRSTLP